MSNVLMNPTGMVEWGIMDEEVRTYLCETVDDGIRAIEGQLKERYYGVNSQLRVAIVDERGRVHHFDACDVSTAESLLRGNVVHVP